ncbi:MAG: 50S ribosomal protein L5 [Candidatus Moranbacteria bacterium]|nr:50S ribosomal protein L5 [Candidatus Moranbacteria bacterium]
MKFNQANDKSKIRKPTYENNLKAKYLKEIVPYFVKKYKLKSRMAAPKLQRIIINSGIGKYKDDKEMPKKILDDISRISGQKAVFTKSKKAVSGFKIKEGQIVGVRVTLRGRRMYDFLERLIVSTLPRVKDFRGIPRSNFGARGNLNIGIKEQLAFPEIDSENTDYIFSLQINIVNSCQNRQKGIELMQGFGFPVQNEELNK